MAMSICSKFSVALLLMFGVFGVANAGECEYFRNKFLELNKYEVYDIEKFMLEVAKDEALCSKNLLGIMFYKGIYFERDSAKAEQIFYDLSNRGYPESSLNFALLMTKKYDQNPVNIIALLLGIYKNNAKSEKGSHLASKARDIARNYLELLPLMIQQCKDSSEKSCGDDLASLNSNDVSELSKAFEFALRDLQADVALNSMSETKEARQRVDNVMSLLSLGLVVYNLNSVGRVSSRPHSSTSPDPNPWFNYNQGFGNPMGLYQFQLH